MYDKNWFGSAIPTRSFEECKEYDIVLRATVRPIGNGKPRWDYENLWTYAEKVITKRKEDGLAAKTKHVEAELAEIRRWRNNQANAPRQSDGPSRERPSYGQGFRGNTTNEEHRYGQGFRGNAPNEEQQRTLSPFCYVCGSHFHTSHSCSATSKSTGSRGPIFLQRRGNGWIIPNMSQDRERVCFRFNLPGSCRIRDCTRGQHICSLCGRSAHGAPSCST